MSGNISIPSPAPFSRRRFLGATGGLSLSAALAAACGSSGGSGGGSSASATAVSQSAIDKAMTTPTTLTFWTWVPDIADEVALFEKKYPAIKVNVVNAG
jgi:multiple sugar transport system substrate-binding protein